MTFGINIDFVFCKGIIILDVKAITFQEETFNEKKENERSGCSSIVLFRTQYDFACASRRECLG